MTKSNVISTEPRNKSFDENIILSDAEINYYHPSNNRHEQVSPKICFNVNCSNKGKIWINIVARFAGYSDHEVPYLICDECNSYLRTRRELMDQLATAMRDCGEVEKIGVDIKTHNPVSGNLVISTKDLDELIFNTQMELIEEDDQDNKKTTTRIDIQPPKQRSCYNMYCSKEGTHRIDILNATTLLADHEIPYFICDTCHAFFEYRRQCPLVFPSQGALFNIESERGKEVSGINPFTGKEVITTTDLHNLLESTKHQGV
jgi:hypothetical protein